MISTEIQHLLDVVKRSAAGPVTLVGGAVRDLLLDRPLHDLDFVVERDGGATARRAANAVGGALYTLDAERETYRVALNPAVGTVQCLDFAAPRAATLEEDLRLRDFTINAMALDLERMDRIQDPLGGASDLRAGRLRACSPTSMVDDPARILRAARMALAFQLRMEPDLIRQIREHAPRLSQVSGERQRDELFQLFASGKAAAALRLLDQLGVLREALPETIAMRGVTQSPPHVYDVWEHTLATVQKVDTLLDALAGTYTEEKGDSFAVGLAVLKLGPFREALRAHFARRDNPLRTRPALLVLAALLHDVEKPAARAVDAAGKTRFIGHPELGEKTAVQVGRRLGLSNEEVDRLATLVREHMRVHFIARDVEHIRRKTIYRFFRDCGDVGVDLCLLALADTWAIEGPGLSETRWAAELEACRQLLEAFWEQKDEVVNPPRLFGGRDLMERFHLQPGPVVGEALEALREAQAEGTVHTLEEAAVFCEAWLAERNR